MAASTRSESTTAAAASTVKIAKNPLEEFFEFDRSQDEDKPVVYGAFHMSFRFGRDYSQVYRLMLVWWCYEINKCDMF